MADDDRRCFCKTCSHAIWYTGYHLDHVVTGNSCADSWAPAIVVPCRYCEQGCESCDYTAVEAVRIPGPTLPLDLDHPFNRPIPLPDDDFDSIPF